MKSHIITLLLAFLLTGCSIMEDYGDSCPDTNVDESECVNLSFRIAVPTTENTRAYDEIESEWPDFEDRIYPDDFAFFIYAELPDGTKPFIMKVTDMTHSTDPHTSISGGPSVYNVKVSIPKNDIESVMPEEGEDFTLRIVAFANTDKKYLTDKQLSDEPTFEELFEKASKWQYNIFGMIYGTATGGITNDGLAPDAKIPMYGTITFMDTRKKLYDSRPDNPIFGGDMHMLRSVAKIKVIDNISGRDNDGLPRIEAVTFSTTTNRAYILPEDYENYVNGSQVESAKPCLVEGAYETTLTLFKKEDKNWWGYIPEQNNGETKFHITVTYKLKEDGTPSVEKKFDVPMTGYNGKEFKFGDAILRNHIYTLSVDLTPLDAQITAEVKNWTPEELILDYTATPSVSQKLIWDETSYESYDINTGVVIVKPASTVESIVPVKGSFILDTPVGATWHAFLIPATGNGNPYAFQFKDKNNNYVSSLSGTIEPPEPDEPDEPGTKIEIEVYPRIVEPEENNEVFLQIVVTLGNGNIIEVPVTPEGKPYKNFTILQNKQ